MQKNRIIILTVFALSLDNTLLPMQDDFNPITKLNTIFKTDQLEKAELYSSEDSTGYPVIQSHENQYTYYITGKHPKNLGESFQRYRALNKNYDRPGKYLAVNGINNRDKGLPLLFNWQMEAIRNIKVIKALFDNGMPVELIETMCYGFFSLASTLYGLQSGSSEAVNLRGNLFIQDSEAGAILEKLKLIIIQSPLLSTQKLLNHFVNPKIETCISASSLIASSVSGCAAMLYNQPINPWSFVHLPFVGLFKSSIASTLSYYGIHYVTSIDQKRGEGLQLLYDLSTKEKRPLHNTTISLSWQKTDNLVDTIRADELECFQNTFRVLCGMGSPYNDHMANDTRQIRVINYARYLNRMPYYAIPELLNTGKKHLKEIEPYHANQDWEGLKEYTEDPMKYIL
ncbi:hypothetical protein EKK58_02575 [Candidatus Dependentiae bacterium]|nr:MAG: hypothetical protein EKK58_02575 [Candidatus Dependentiae bacterium]